MLPCTTRILAVASGVGCAFPAIHPAPLSRSRRPTAPPSSVRPHSLLPVLPCRQEGQVQEQGQDAQPLEPHELRQLERGQPGPQPGIPQVPREDHGDGSPAKRGDAGKKGQLGRPGEPQTDPEQGEGQPREDEKQVAERAKQQQDEQRRRPGHVPEFVGRVRHPMEADEAEEKLGQPPPPKDFPYRAFPEPEQPQRYEAKKERPGRERNIAGPEQKTRKQGQPVAGKAGTHFRHDTANRSSRHGAIGSRAGGAGRTRTSGLRSFRRISPDLRPIKKRMGKGSVRGGGEWSGTTGSTTRTRGTRWRTRGRRPRTLRRSSASTASTGSTARRSTAPGAENRSGKRTEGADSGGIKKPEDKVLTKARND